jgi:multisubunit Na+/H+ antiporter MnhG subunit
MATIEKDLANPNRNRELVKEVPNGAAMAAFLAAGIGAFAVGLFVLLNETGIFKAPTLYEPAGGVSGRTTLAVVAWLVAWGVLHARWKEREVAAAAVWVVTVILTALGILGTFPPFWGVVS